MFCYVLYMCGSFVLELMIIIDILRVFQGPVLFQDAVEVTLSRNNLSVRCHFRFWSFEDANCLLLLSSLNRLSTCDLFLNAMNVHVDLLTF